MAVPLDGRHPSDITGSDAVSPWGSPFERPPSVFRRDHTSARREGSREAVSHFGRSPNGYCLGASAELTLPPPTSKLAAPAPCPRMPCSMTSALDTILERSAAGGEVPGVVAMVANRDGLSTKAPSGAPGRRGCADDCRHGGLDRLDDQGDHHRRAAAAGRGGQGRARCAGRRLCPGNRRGRPAARLRCGGKAADPFAGAAGDRPPPPHPHLRLLLRLRLLRHSQVHEGDGPPRHQFRPHRLPRRAADRRAGRGLHLRHLHRLGRPHRRDGHRQAAGDGVPRAHFRAPRHAGFDVPPRAGPDGAPRHGPRRQGRRRLCADRHGGGAGP